MEHLLITARNIRYSVDPKTSEINTEIEAVLTVSSRGIEFIGGGYVNVDKLKTLRFSMDIESARKFAENILSWTDDAEKEMDRLSFKKDDEQ